MGGIISFFLLVIGLFVASAVLGAIKIIRQSTVGVVERFGQYSPPIKQAGLTFIIPFVDRLLLVDMREQVMPLPPQPVITKDNVTMNIDAVIYFQVTDPFRATYEVAGLYGAVEKLALTNMRNIIGEMSLDQTLSSRDVINHKLQGVLEEATAKWGLLVNRVELKDINPPRDIEEAMQKQMRAEREKRSQILLAEGEKQAAILKAEGQKESAILAAEGEKEAQVRLAEGDKQAKVLMAQGQAESIRLVQQAEAEMRTASLQAIKTAAPTDAVLQVRYLEALEKAANGNATKILLPFESAGFMGTLAAAAEGLSQNSSNN